MRLGHQRVRILGLPLLAGLLGKSKYQHAHVAAEPINATIDEHYFPSVIKAEMSARVWHGRQRTHTSADVGWCRIVECTSWRHRARVCGFAGSDNTTNGSDSICERACETQESTCTWLGRKRVHTWRLSPPAGLLGTSKWNAGARRRTGREQFYGVLKMYRFLSDRRSPHKCSKAALALLHWWAAAACQRTYLNATSPLSCTYSHHLKSLPPTPGQYPTRTQPKHFHKPPKSVRC